MQLLGEPSVERDGTPLVLPGPQHRLLVSLALAREPVGRDRLAARFWPDVPDRVARANLRTSVWALRRVLDDEVVATRTTLGLRPGRVETDLGRVRGLIGAGDARGAAAACGTAALLEGWTQEWAERARAEHRTDLIGLLDAAAASAERDGDPADAVRWSRRRCALTPLDEPAHRDLLRRLVAAGDRAGALVAGREFTGRLRDELGVVPDAATRAVLDGLHGLRTAGPVAFGAPFVGRAVELRLLGAAWTAARRGCGRVVVVTGEAGIGRTRLVAEMAARAAGCGGGAAVGTASDVGGESPLALWQELARALAAEVPVPPARALWPADLGRFCPDLILVWGRSDAPAPVAAPELERLRVRDAVVHLVEWAAHDRPLLLVAEDVQRADRASLALLAHVGRRLTDLPVLLVLTRVDRPARPEVDAVLADLHGRGVTVDELVVGALPDHAVARMVRATASLDDHGVARAVRAAEGNPMLAAESARALAAGPADGLVTVSLRARVRSATACLDGPSHDLVEILAVAGRPLATCEIAALDLPEGTLHQVLDTGLLARTATGLGYRHRLLAEAARSTLDDPCHARERLVAAIGRAARRGRVVR
ncbi:AAA family ATPase [Pseudonocardia nematodicida]|uniref:AAA family ATPase n=1 Tax=Pseudonocardia nematodicida TaxID=1206997 RepID=A0ABV1K4K0_9PSEU